MDTSFKLAVGAMTEPLHTYLKDVLEICYLGVFEKTITLMVSKRSLTQFTVNENSIFKTNIRLSLLLL